MKTNSYHYKYNVRFRKGIAHKERHKNMTYMYLYTASFSLCCNASFAKVLPVVRSFSRRLMVADLSSSALVYVFQDCKSSSNGSTCSMVCSRHQLQRKKNGGTGVNVMYSFQHLNWTGQSLAVYFQPSPSLPDNLSRRTALQGLCKCALVYVFYRHMSLGRRSMALSRESSINCQQLLLLASAEFGWGNDLKCSSLVNFLPDCNRPISIF